jgi:putative membrane protein
MPLMMLVLLGGLVWFVVAIGQVTPSPPFRRDPEADAERILDERYARGEIDDDEYRRRIDVLRATKPSPHS